MPDNIKYRRLKAFCLALEAGSFKSAADLLSVTQSTFSGLIKELEEDAGIKLFERGTRRCDATPAGREFHQRIAAPIAQIESAYRDLKELAAGRRGTLNISVLPSAASGMAMDCLSDFQTQNPLVQIRIRDRKNAHVLDAVRLGEAEIDIGALDERAQDPDLEFEPLYEDRMAIVAPPGHRCGTAA